MLGPLSELCHTLQYNLRGPSISSLTSDGPCQPLSLLAGLPDAQSEVASRSSGSCCEFGWLMKCNLDLPGLPFLARFREIVTAIASNTKHGMMPIAQHGVRKLILPQISQTLETDSQATVHGIRLSAPI